MAIPLNSTKIKTNSHDFLNTSVGSAWHIKDTGRVAKTICHVETSKHDALEDHESTAPLRVCKECLVLLSMRYKNIQNVHHKILPVYNS